MPRSRLVRLAAFLWRHLGVIALIGLAALVTTLLLLDGRRTVEEITTGTGYLVADVFQPFYEEHGGAEVLGYPLTEAYQADAHGRLRQYFQNMLLEYDQAARAVVIINLGRWALPSEENQVPAPEAEPASGRTFDATGFSVRGEFLTFYEEMAGETLLGLPLSDELNEGGTRAQYFENGLLEWHPELGLNRRVQLGPLGEAHYLHEGWKNYREVTNAIPNLASTVRKVSVEAVFWAPILYAGDEQTVFVTITRPGDRLPVREMRLRATITYDGESHEAILPLTDGAGRSETTLKLDGATPGQKVLVKITAERPDGLVVGEGTFSFRTWW